MNYPGFRGLAAATAWVSLVGLGAWSGCATSTALPDGAARAITADVAGKYAVYAMMAANAYEKADRIPFPLEKLGWIKVGLDDRPIAGPTVESGSGLAYNVYRKPGTKEVVFAFRGTDSKRDWPMGNIKLLPFGSQYDRARKQFEKYFKDHPDDHFTVTGHSLGGGISLSISVRSGIDAIVFDSSPRISDGIGDEHKPAKRVLIYEEGEILEAFRMFRHKVFEVVGPENVYRCTFDFQGQNKHGSAELALGLLKLGATANPELAPVLSAFEQGRVSP